MKTFIFVLLFLFPLSKSVGSESHWDYGSGMGSESHWDYGSGLTFPDNPMIDVCLGLRGSGYTLPSICNYITPK
jgi:hypothetical protein